ncbi:hypothetical protein [Enterococcus massiliensis]|uniref:hypothetical protein n=2 Tax=Enterococcus TaxID=1350 RepID=UPI0008598875|nr:hypothetical protein [Enterococcus massiliensis]
MKNWTKNQKIDFLYEIIFFLIYFIVLLIVKLIGWDNHFEYFLFLLAISTSGILKIRRQKKRFRKIGQLQKILPVSIEEMRAISGAGRYDLIEWKEDKMMITPKQMYILEDYLDKKYFLKYGEEFNKKENR